MGNNFSLCKKREDELNPAKDDYSYSPKKSNLSSHSKKIETSHIPNDKEKYEEFLEEAKMDEMNLKEIISTCNYAHNIQYYQTISNEEGLDEIKKAQMLEDLLKEIVANRYSKNNKEELEMENFFTAEKADIHKENMNYRPTNPIIEKNNHQNNPEIDKINFYCKDDQSENLFIAEKEDIVKTEITSSPFDVIVCDRKVSEIKLEHDKMTLSCKEDQMENLFSEEKDDAAKTDMSFSPFNSKPNEIKIKANNIGNGQVILPCNLENLELVEENQIFLASQENNQLKNEKEHLNFQKSSINKDLSEGNKNNLGLSTKNSEKKSNLNENNEILKESQIPLVNINEKKSEIKTDNDQNIKQIQEEQKSKKQNYHIEETKEDSHHNHEKKKNEIQIQNINNIEKETQNNLLPENDCQNKNKKDDNKINKSLVKNECNQTSEKLQHIKKENLIQQKERCEKDFEEKNNEEISENVKGPQDHINVEKNNEDNDSNTDKKQKISIENGSNSQRLNGILNDLEENEVYHTIEYAEPTDKKIDIYVKGSWDLWAQDLLLEKMENAQSYKCKIKLKKGMRYEYKFRFGEESWETGNNRIIEL